MHATSYWTFKESFVAESVAYTWKTPNSFAMRHFELEARLAGKDIRAAEYWQPNFRVKLGGVLAVDADKVSELVATLTCLVVVRKIRQKRYEQRRVV